MNKPQVVETAVALHESNTSVTPMVLLNQAVAAGNTELAGRLMDLYERWERNQAKQNFNIAFCAAKAEIPPIKKNRHVGFDSRKPGGARTDYDYEDLAEIARTVDPILAKHGLAYRWQVSSKVGQPIIVTCILAHRDGYSEENTMEGPRDDSGNKNALQQIGSAQTFLERYTLKASLGLATEDDDARATSEGITPVSAEQLETIRSLIAEHGKDIAKFCTFMKVERIEDIPSAKFDDAVTAIKYKRPDAKQ